jgi:hypothetical protein
MKEGLSKEKQYTEEADQNLKSKTYGGWCPYQVLSNGTTPMQI